MHLPRFTLVAKADSTHAGVPSLAREPVTHPLALQSAAATVGEAQRTWRCIINFGNPGFMSSYVLGSRPRTKVELSGGMQQKITVRLRSTIALQPVGYCR